MDILASPFHCILIRGTGGGGIIGTFLTSLVCIPKNAACIAEVPDVGNGILGGGIIPNNSHSSYQSSSSFFDPLEELLLLRLLCRIRFSDLIFIPNILLGSSSLSLESNFYSTHLN
jgi:hypothetical protein